MKTFKDFNIKADTKCFVGDKIKMAKIVNREIVVSDYKLGDTKVYRDGTKCLQLQIKVGADNHVVFTSAIGLIEAIEQVPKEGFPFTTTIIEENDRFLFT